MIELFWTLIEFFLILLGVFIAIPLALFSAFVVLSLLWFVFWAIADLFLRKVER